MRPTISRRGRREPPYGITTADGSHLDDVSRRQKQYAATMTFRVVAILVVVLVPGLSVMERVILGLVATIIPYVAVIRANGGPDSSGPTNLMIGGPQQNELPPVDRALGGQRRVDGEAADGEDPENEDRDADADEDEDENEDGAEAVDGQAAGREATGDEDGDHDGGHDGDRDGESAGSAAT